VGEVVLSAASPAGPPMPTEGITAGVNGGSNVAIGNDSRLRPGGEAALIQTSNMTAMLHQARGPLGLADLTASQISCMLPPSRFPSPNHGDCDAELCRIIYQLPCPTATSPPVSSFNNAASCVWRLSSRLLSFNGSLCEFCFPSRPLIRTHLPRALRVL
jgi:hypothetical protein